MNCSHCQMPVDDPNAAICPRCGNTLQTAQEPEVPVTAVAASDAPAPLPGISPPPMGPLPGYGASPSGSLYGPGMYGPGVPPPPYSPYPSYPVYPPLSMYPPYGGPAPGTVPLPVPPAAPARRNHYALTVLTVLLLVIVVAGGGAALYLVANGKHGPNVNIPSAVTATATPGYNIVFQDPLTANTNGWPDTSNCHFGSDGYHVTDRICYAPAGTFTNFDLSVDAVQVKGVITEFYGVVFRRQSKGNFYSFQIDSNGNWRVIEANNNQGIPLIRYIPNSAINQGLHAKNVLEVRASGTHFEFYINGTKVGQMEDSMFASGYCGFEVYQYIEVAYTNLTISVPAS